MTSTSLSEKAYHHIRRQVFSGELQPGAQLVNRTLAAQLGTSFIPVREAISRLASEGVVEQVAGAGAFVKKFDRQEISEIYDVREQFEPFAAGEAARLMTSHELDELTSLLAKWDSLGRTVLNRKRGATEADLDRWLEINERFHEVMITAARNRFLAKIMNDVHVLSQCFAAQRGSPKLLSAHLVNSTIESHQRLLERLKARDSEAAQDIVREQLQHGRQAVLGFFDQNRIG